VPILLWWRYRSGLPAILLDGPKGVGKTATGERRARTVIRLDIPSQLQIAEADPDAILDADPPGTHRSGMR
jgi:hypothetical protein